MFPIVSTYEMWYRDSPRWTLSDYHAAMLDQCEILDKHGLAEVQFHEHHGADGNWTPSPLVLSAAVAARTKNTMITPLVLAPLNHPVKLAEDIAVLDQISNGRMSIMLGAGYRPEEFEMFGRSLSDRRKLVDGTVEILRQAWTGEPFTFEGRTARVRPVPVQKPGPRIVIGGTTPAAARSAAAIADGFDPAGGHDAHWWQAYVDELERLGKPVPEKPHEILVVAISEDPERDRARVEPRAWDMIESVNAWGRKAGNRPKTEEARAERRKRKGFPAHQHTWVITPDEAVERLTPLVGVGHLHLCLMLGGSEPDLASTTIELLVNKVLPRLSRGTPTASVASADAV